MSGQIQSSFLLFVGLKELGPIFIAKLVIRQ
jgi:hypothetical protein